MSKKLSYKGQLDMGLEDRIRLRTLKGKTGYKISKFQIISKTPGVGDYEYVAKITKVPDPNIGATISFTDADLLGIVYYKGKVSANEPANTDTIIFDNEKFNQDIFINITDAGGGTIPCNYYIELETMPLTDLETTKLTLQSIRQVTSR